MRFVREGIIIGPLFLHYYGLIIMLGVLAGVRLAMEMGKKRGYSGETYWDMTPWMLISGILGARLWHVLMPSVSSGLTFGWYLQHPGEIFAVWKGGLGIPGGVLGGTFGIWLFCRRNKINYADFMDTIAPAVPLGQAIGRWGNYVNQELYGRPSTLPWAITIDPAYRPPEYAGVSTYHPLFLYESLYNLLVVLLLLKLDRSERVKLREGSLFLIYLIAYPVGRFFLEFLRLDTAQIGGININQTVMAVTAAAAAVFLVIREKASSNGGQGVGNVK